MVESLIHTSEYNNSYIYDDQSRLSILVHPDLRKVHEKLTDADPYYSKKYEYLRKHGFFAKPKPVHFGTVTDSMVKEGIIQVPKILFEVTDSCNLNCTYCGYGEFYEGYDARNNKNISIRSAKKLLKYTFNLKRKNNNNKLLIGFYGGEPLLNMGFIKQIVTVVNQLTAEKEMNIEFTMTTNATLLHKYIDFLVANKFKLFISLDGNENNHSYRVFSQSKENSFQKVIENVDQLQRDYLEYFDSHVNFNAVLHDRNSVKEIYEFIYARYRKIPVISELALDDVTPDKKDILERMFQSKRKSRDEYQNGELILLPKIYNNSLYNELLAFIEHFSINFYVANITALFTTVEKYFPTSTCLPFSRNMFLTTKNKLLPCETINYKYFMGEVKNSVMIDIPQITRQYNMYYDHLKKVCQYCHAYKFCSICMFSIANLDTLDTDGFVCSGFYDQKAFQKKLCRIFSFAENNRIDFSQILENGITE